MDWNGQVAVVTGGSRGIGAAICRRLAKRGAAVGINYVARSTEAEALRAEIVAAGGRAALLQADVADSAAVAAMFAEAEEKLGTVSIRSIITRVLARRSFGTRSSGATVTTCRRTSKPAIRRTCRSTNGTGSSRWAASRSDRRRSCFPCGGPLAEEIVELQQ